jgi:hypothetical protein
MKNKCLYQFFFQVIFDWLLACFIDHVNIIRGRLLDVDLNHPDELDMKLFIEFFEA